MDTGEITISGLSTEEAYRLLVEGSPAPVWINYDNRIVYINRAGLKLLGATSAAQVVGRTPFDFIHPRYHDDIRDRVARLTSGEATEIAAREEEVVRLDGTLVPVNVSAAIFPYRGGTALQTHFVDISELRHSRDFAVSTEQRFRALVENVSEYAIFGITPAGIVASWNKGAERIKGYTEGEIVGQPYARFYTQEDQQARLPQEALRRAADEGSFAAEGWRVRKDGTRFWASVSITAIRDANGRLQGFSKVTRDQTELHQIEQTLRESEQRFRSTFEQAAVGIAHVGLAGEWLRVNERLCQIVGYTREELLHLRFSDITYPEDLAEDWEHARALQRGDIRTYSMEKRYVSKDGSVVWVNLTASLLRDGAGAPQYYIAVVEDISARKRVEVDLQTSEDSFRTLFEVSPVANYLIDPATEMVVTANERAAAQLGYTRDQLLQLRLSDFDAAFSRPELRRNIDRNMAGSSMAFETCHRMKNGELRDVFVTSDPVHVDGRTLIYASALDITERKKAERAVQEFANTLQQRVEERTRELEEQRLFLEAVLDSLEVGVVSCDSEGRLTLFNRAATEWHGQARAGWRPEEWAEHSLYELDGRTPLGLKNNPLLRALQGESVHEAAMVIAPEHGPARTVLVTGRALVGIDGHRQGAVIAMHDVTQQHRAEAERRRAILRLREANQELEAFAHTVSHDLRAPLRSIEGFGRILVRDHGPKLDEAAAGHLRRISAATHRMGQLIDDLLMLSRISRQELRRSRVDLAALAESIVKELRDREPDRKVALSVEAGLAAHADARLTRVLLENLLGNAWKFTSKTAEARIEFSAAEEADGARVFVVRDNGAGFDMAYSEQLFRPFQRLHQAHEFEGTGIGLATVRRIVARHGGRVWAEAKPGSGATFFFVLEAETNDEQTHPAG